MKRRSGSRVQGKHVQRRSPVVSAPPLGTRPHVVGLEAAQTGTGEPQEFVQGTPTIVQTLVNTLITWRVNDWFSSLTSES